MGTKTQRNRFRVAVLGNDALARGGLAALLAADPELAVVAQLAPHEARLAARERPHAGVWDVGGGTGAVVPLVSELPFPILALVPDTAGAAAALGAGARGILFRDSATARLVAALQALVAGLVVLEETLAPEILHVRPGGSESALESLTRREVEVLQLLSRGFANKQIAAALGISDHTAKFHVNAILGKLGATGRTEAVVRAARLGLVVL